MEVVRKKLEAEAGTIPGVTYDPDTDEVLYNGEPNENFDPRNNPAYQYDTSGNNACGAAEGMRVEIAKWVLGVVGATSVVGLANTGLTAALFLLPISWMFGMFWAVANAALLIGSVTIGNAFTPAVLDTIKCILAMCVEPDGSITEAGLAQARAGIVNQINDVVVTACFDLMVQSWGFVGFTNAGVINYDPMADCDDCCLPYGDEMIGSLGWRTHITAHNNPINGSGQGVYVASPGHASGGGSVQSVNVIGQYNHAFVMVDMGRDCVIGSARFYHARSNTSGGYTIHIRVYTEAGVLAYSENAASGNPTLPTWGVYNRFIGLGTGRYVCFWLEGNNHAFVCYVSDIDVNQ